MNKYLNLFGLLACCALVAVGSYQKRPPKPVPETAAKCFVDFQSAVVKAWTDGAAMSFQTDKEAHDWLQSQGLAAFKNAFAPVRQRQEDALGGLTEDGKLRYDDATRQKLWLQFAKEAQ